MVLAWWLSKHRFSHNAQQRPVDDLPVALDLTIRGVHCVVVVQDFEME